MRASLKFRYCVETCSSIPLGLAQFGSVRSILTAPPDAVLLRHPSFVPVADLPGLPRILLLGDSISMGYTVPARRELMGIANVRRPQENCSHSRNALEHIDKWLLGGNWDTIHFNFGLHDLALDGDKPVVPPGEYAANLLRLTDILRETGASLVWASTTPVPRDLVARDPVRGNTFTQRAGDVEIYNRVACDVMVARGIPVNDLNALSKPRLSQLQIPDDIHFSRKGYRFLGTHVARFLARMPRGRSLEELMG